MNVAGNPKADPEKSVDDSIWSWHGKDLLQASMLVFSGLSEISQGSLHSCLVDFLLETHRIDSS